MSLLMFCMEKNTIKGISVHDIMVNEQITGAHTTS